MAQQRRKIGSGTPLEAAGYSRAERAGDRVFVAGTEAFRDGQPAAPDAAAGQTRHILGIIDRALRDAGANMADVVRYRAYGTDLADAPAVMVALGETFRGIDPADTLVGASGLAHPDLLVEIEADAIVGE